MRRKPKEQPTVVAQPPPEAVHRVGGGGPWGPTRFDLPDPRGNRSSILLVALVGVGVLLALVGFLTWFYLHTT